MQNMRLSICATLVPTKFRVDFPLSKKKWSGQLSTHNTKLREWKWKSEKEKKRRKKHAIPMLRSNISININFINIANRKAMHATKLFLSPKPFFFDGSSRYSRSDKLWWVWQRQTAKKNTRIYTSPQFLWSTVTKWLSPSTQRLFHSIQEWIIRGHDFSFGFHHLKLWC